MNGEMFNKIVYLKIMEEYEPSDTLLTFGYLQVSLQPLKGKMSRVLHTGSSDFEHWN